MKDKTHAKAVAVGRGARTGVDVVDGAAVGASVAATGGTITATRPRRHPVVLALAVGAALMAAAYGHFGLAMRFGPPLVMVALGGLTLAFAAAALWRVIDPLTRDEVVLVADSRAPYRIRELEREKQAVLKAIKEIELDYQMRKISEADYREMVERYRTRALRLLGDLAAGDDIRALIERELKNRLAARAAAGPDDELGGTGAASGGVASSVAIARDSSASPAAPAAAVATSQTSPTSCGACGTSNDVDAQFCKQCGHKLGSSSPSA